ncbi:LuxR C-terminal-related transcriptional regulator [Leptolyngbya sp. NIES-2104]|uniref:LuxR C-terminal-related transcriptional regulator n=1 Tax=Leptolyngbya sp. NIES-2104 TaxID=1552121 RepID=UPI0006EC632A|nr:LuxR C-terminal-related transcriptional regulator [Leptolyngbya sp. NIES-2104]GAP96904.1 transcriptional regulator [Leptolyngbya sp. NIES-2104]
MSIPLKLLFEEIHQAENENSLRSHLAPKIGEYFAAKRSGIFFFDQILADKNLQKVLKVALSVEHNPVARYLTERHTPVHEGLVTSPKAWAIVCPRPDHWHVMAGPIVSHGQLVGVVGCTRDKSMPAFDTQNLADLSGICLHLSAWTATTRSHADVSVREAYSGRSGNTGKIQHPLFRSNLLTARELQIAELVSLGRTNAEIGNELWIAENSVKQALKRMFRKLGVSSRAEMVAQLYAERIAV